MTNLKIRVYENRDKLNNSEKQVIRYVLNNPKLCSNLSLSKLAKKLYVSESAIFRLCKKLGLNGYSELKFSLKEFLYNKNNEQDLNSKKKFPKNLAAGIAEVQKYFSSLNLTKLFQNFSQASNIYIYSTGWVQELIAGYLAHQLFLIHRHVTILPAAVDEVRAITNYAQKNDVLVIISYNGNNSTINDELVKLKLTNNQLKYVSFTNLRQNKLSSLTEYNFYYPTIAFNKNAYMGDLNNAFAPAYYLIDLLINGYFNWQKNN